MASRCCTSFWWAPKYLPVTSETRPLSWPCASAGESTLRIWIEAQQYTKQIRTYTGCVRHASCPAFQTVDITPETTESTIQLRLIEARCTSWHIRWSASATASGRSRCL